MMDNSIENMFPKVNKRTLFIFIEYKTCAAEIYNLNILPPPSHDADRTTTGIIQPQLLISSKRMELLSLRKL